MAELTLTAFLSLDGVMQAPGGPTEDPSGGFAHGGWVVPHIDEEFGATIDAIFAKPAAFLLGRTTYDIFASHWPRVSGPDPVAGKLNGLPKFVASRTRTSFDWQGTSLVRDVVKEVPELKRRFEGELQVHGSLGLAQTLIQHDLVDEYRLLVFPVLLGSGRRLFGQSTVPANLRLVSANTTSKGTVVAVYRRGGPFTTGAIGLET